jgi:hypothetical protein
VSELKENEYEINAHNNVSLKLYQGAGEENFLPSSESLSIPSISSYS